ncbi:hypothetical protein 2AV2_137 [Nodularia phage vB_NpeS-2AV2]|jgi:hypothetical protein|uniref:Uncharacterized protein n=3 Tax=Ravarandavirus TaxID=2843444 RepID=A0A482MKG2_9CAUD|nr:hypothetical protein HWA92_gp137 [Nodularia phage vB_NpeS-2AV2]YP_009844959.1 hypothetical protein HWC13_gp161 [Nodularia phage vB_NspS-kac68v161]ALY07589.1 hypothetical protein 2AV2_137 [Nodularia phage vB_NpeS-2AV2]QBQ73800.1 hypothetical protein kac68v161_gp150 [Nodularia phage vB_NspS-kac68v161]QBQ73996.1 hypothetical protein kac68v162_gp148 [Nodularia phage vB_NspS-kac68v162]
MNPKAIIYNPELKSHLDKGISAGVFSPDTELSFVAIIAVALHKKENLSNTGIMFTPFLQSFSLQTFLEDCCENIDRELTASEAFMVYDLHREMINHYTN